MADALTDPAAPTTGAPTTGAHTAAATREAPVPRPQPLGTFPLPAGYLLVPPGEDTEQARIELLAGCIPHPWPTRLRAHQLALAGDVDGALDALTQLESADPDPATAAVTRFNRFVMDPDAADPDRLRADLGELGPLVDVVSFSLGRTDTPPQLSGTGGEVAALVLSAQATHAAGRNDREEALRLLDQAVDAVRESAPPLAGLLLGASVSLCKGGVLDDGVPQDGVPQDGVMDDAQAVERLERALQALDAADGLRVGRAELHLTLAGLLHGLATDRPDQLARAIPHYHSALQLVTAVEAPQLWAAAHANLAAAYLTMPMTEASGQLRLGVAVQSLRSALTVYTHDEHPREWASTQLNLANSLVYTPSTHQGDNLAEAVELYEALLEVRTRQDDPVGRARVLANQGNALAHLGAFDQAKAKLYEARFLFEEAGDGDSVRAVRGVLDEIARQLALDRTRE